MIRQRSRSRRWTKEEDAVVNRAVKKMKQNEEHRIFSALNLKQVTEKIKRTPKQIQERYENVLRPGLKKGEWSKDEKIRLLNCIKVHGQRWRDIRDVITNRSFHSIKMKGRWILGEVRTRRKSSRHQKECSSNTWYDRKLKRLMVLHKIFNDNFKAIQKHLLFNRPIAEIERAIYFSCFCKSCVQVKAQIFEHSVDFKDGWSKFKASRLLELEKDVVDLFNEDVAMMIGSSDVEFQLPQVADYVSFEHDFDAVLHELSQFK